MKNFDTNFSHYLKYNPIQHSDTSEVSLQLELQDSKTPLDLKYLYIEQTHFVIPQQKYAASVIKEALFYTCLLVVLLRKYFKSKKKLYITQILGRFNP